MINRHTKYYAAAAVSLLTLAVYMPALRNGFLVWDDNINITGNIHIRMPAAAFFRWAFSDIRLSYWQPLNWISYAIDYRLWGLNPMGYHLTGIALHSINTFLVVCFAAGSVRYIYANEALPDGPQHPANDLRGLIVGTIAGLLFGLHPLHVEPSVWISNRSELLCFFFFVASIAAYAGYVPAPGIKAAEKRGNHLLNRRYLLSLVLFCLALATKPAAVTLPVVLIILDLYPFSRIRSLKSFWEACTEKLPFLAPALIASIAALWSEKVRSRIALPEEVQFASTVLTSFKAATLYLWKLVLPLELSPFYPQPVKVSFFSAEYILPVIFVSGITAACVLTFGKRKIFAAAWGIYLVTLLPVLGIGKVRDVYMADRYFYLPGLVPFLLIGFGAAVVWMKADSSGYGKKFARLLLSVIAASLFAGMSYLTVKQIAVWKDTITLWSYVIEREPASTPVPYINRGLAFRENGGFAEALKDYSTAIRLAPRYADAYVGRGLVYHELGRNDHALDDYNTAVSLMPRSAEAYTNRGIVFGETGRFSLAIQDFDRAIVLNREYADAYIGRAVAYMQTGELQRSLDDCNAALQLNPFSADAFLNRGVVLEQMGQLDRAIADYDKAVELRPDDALAYLNRGAAYLKTGRSGQALKDYTKACDLGSNEGCSALRAAAGR